MNIFKYVIGYLIYKIHAGEAYYRIESYKKKIKGQGYRLNAQVSVNHPENVYIGRGTYINGGEICASPNAIIKIGDNCLISYMFFCRTDSHIYQSKDMCINSQGIVEKNITIGNDVWIGYDVKVMPGVTIADGCVIGAGSVVTKSTEPYSVYVGIPARKVSERV